MASTDVNLHVIRKIDSAQKFLCDNDTLSAIRQLEQIEHEYPNDAHIIFSSKLLGDLYFIKGDTEKSLKSLLHALNCTIGPYVYKGTIVCEKQSYPFFYFSYGKADICISISKVYQSKKKYDSSLHYLNLADDKYLPYKGCGNGIISAKSHLSLFFADHFIAAGDTAKAINRLLDFFMLVDGDMNALTSKLKAILKYTYTQQQINSEVEAGINNLKIVSGKDGQPKELLEFKLFNHLIHMFRHEKTIEQWRDILTNRKSIKQLVD